MIAPDDVVLVECNPLGDTFGRSEREIAAALIVRACQRRGTSSWAPVALAEIETLIATCDPWTVALLRNPIHSPDFVDLVERGFATWNGESEGATISLTDRALDRLERSLWVRRPS